MLAERDPLVRAVAARQLARLRRSSERLAAHGDAPPSGPLIGIVEGAVGPLRAKPSGDLEGPCPWHASTSGRCLVVFAGGRRWWCRSCRRGGDAVSWLMLTEGMSASEARRRLGLTVDRRAAGRPTLSVGTTL